MLDTDELTALLGEVFAPWIQALGIAPVSVAATGAVFTLPGGAQVMRGGGNTPPVVCGQAIAAAADTCSVLALCALNGRFRNCTTVDLTTHFMRPVTGDARIEVEVLSNGRRMAVTRVTVRGGNGKPAASATLAFAYLED